MYFAGDKSLPDIPLDIDGGTVIEDDGSCLVSRTITTFANMGNALPTTRAENTLSGEEMRRLHELWNEAGLSARAQRKKRRAQNATLSPRRIPAPISIPKPESTLSSLSLVDPSTTSTTPPTTGTRRRWGLLSARPFPEERETEKKSPSALETLRAKAQQHLKRKLRYAKSAPNLGDQDVPLEPQVIERPPMPRRAEANPKVMLSRATPRVDHQPWDTDENAIYFTMDPNWRESQGSVQFQSITSVPDSPNSLGRPDSPLLHRHHSLDQLSFAAQQTVQTPTTIEFPEIYSYDEARRLIDELHTYP